MYLNFLTSNSLEPTPKPIRLSSPYTKFVRAGFTYGVPVFVSIPIFLMYLGETKPPICIPLIWLSFSGIGYFFVILRIHAKLCDVEVAGKDVVITDARGAIHTVTKSRLTVQRYMLSSIYYLTDTKERKYWFVSTMHPLDRWDMDDVIRAEMRKE